MASTGMTRSDVSGLVELPADVVDRGVVIRILEDILCLVKYRWSKVARTGLILSPFHFSTQKVVPYCGMISMCCLSHNLAKSVDKHSCVSGVDRLLVLIPLVACNLPLVPWSKFHQVLSCPAVQTYPLFD